MAKRHTTETFIESVKDKYPTFDFSRVVFTKMMDKVQVACTKHDIDLEMTAYDLSRGRNSCPLCGGKKMTTEQFVQAARKIHGDKFDYSATVLGKRVDKVKFDCKKHGSVEQIALNHLRGENPCGDCTGKKRITPESFIERSKEKHGTDFFDYSRVPEVFSGAARTRVQLMCNKHEEWFEHTAWSNLQGANGCSQCSSTVKMTYSRLVERSKKVFPHKDYDYSQVVFVGTVKEKVTIGCPVEGHGTFQQSLDGHLSGKEGCRLCRL